MDRCAAATWSVHLCAHTKPAAQAPVVALLTGEQGQPSGTWCVVRGSEQAARCKGACSAAAATAAAATAVARKRATRPFGRQGGISLLGRPAQRRNSGGGVSNLRVTLVGGVLNLETDEEYWKRSGVGGQGERAASGESLCCAVRAALDAHPLPFSELGGSHPCVTGNQGAGNRPQQIMAPAAQHQSRLSLSFLLPAGLGTSSDRKIRSSETELEPIARPLSQPRPRKGATSPEWVSLTTENAIGTERAPGCKAAAAAAAQPRELPPLPLPPRQPCSDAQLLIFCAACWMQLSSNGRS